MKPETATQQPIELNRLHREYESIRMNSAGGLFALTNSMRQQGQLVPVIALKQTDNHWLLLDGYRRVKAAIALGQDTIIAEIWIGSVAEGLLRLLAQQNSRGWHAIEEAQMLQELKATHGYSLHHIASKINRNVSFVSRRIGLIEGLPEWIIAAVMNNQLQPWAATHCLGPLSRGNSEHAKLLLEFIKKNPLSTRQLSEFFQHYQQSNIQTRQRIVEQPELFLKTKQCLEQHNIDKQLKLGPEGIWLSQMQKITKQVQQQISQFNNVFYDNQQDTLYRSLLKTFDASKTQFLILSKKIEEIIHARKTKTISDTSTTSRGSVVTAN